MYVIVEVLNGLKSPLSTNISLIYLDSVVSVEQIEPINEIKGWGL